MNKKDDLIKELYQLKQEHKDLDEILMQLQNNQTVNLLQVQRLKKRKLFLKDRIISLSNKIEPDIIA